MTLYYIFCYIQIIFKRDIYPIMKILSLFTHPQVVPNLYEFHSAVEQKIIYSDEWWSPNS